MARDPLDALLRMNRLSQEEAMRDLANCLAEEAAAAAAVERMEESIAAEEAAASSLEADDVAVESFGRWLGHTRTRHVAAVAARDRAEAGTVRARAVLGAARGALAAVEAELARRAEAARVIASRVEQAALDEHTGRRRE